MTKTLLSIFIGLFILFNFAAAQMPTPTPVQIPTLQGMTYEPSLIARDDFYSYTRTDGSSQVYYPSLENDQGPPVMGLFSRTHNLGTIDLTTCGFGVCPPNTAISYRHDVPGALYGVDFAYYYLTTFTVGTVHSNLARITIISTPSDDAENAGAACPIVGQPVNVTNGNMWLEHTDYSLPGIGDPLEIKRFYNSIIQTGGIFGRGWSTKYDESLQFYGNQLIRLNMPDGRAVYFTREGTTGPFLPHTPQAYAFVDKNADGTYTLTFKNGWKHHFNALGALQWQRDRNGNQTTLHYDANNVLTGVTDANGNTLTIVVSNGLAQSISDPMGTVATYTYCNEIPGCTEPPNVLKEVFFQDGAKYKFEYNTTAVPGKAFISAVKDAADKILEAHEYDSLGRATTSEKQDGVEKYIFDYSNWNLPAPQVWYTLVKHKKLATDANFIETKYYLDKSKGRNFVSRSEGNCNCGGGTEETVFEYDDRLNLKKKRERISATAWRETTFTYNYQGDVLTKTDVWGTESFTYNAYGQVLTSTDRMNGVWTITYDANGNVKTVKNPLNQTTTFNYPASGNKGLPTSVVDARNNETEFFWNSKNLLHITEDALGNQTTRTYDARGRVVTEKNALNHTATYNYFDDAQRKVEIVFPNADKVIYKYDVRRLLEKITDERGKDTTFEYDGARRLTKVTDPLLHTREFGYDLMSNRISSKDAYGRETNYQFDDFDRLTEITYPAAEAGATRLKENFVYDDLGRTISASDTAGRITTYNYFDSLRKYEVINAENEKTTIEYNRRFQTEKVTDAKNQLYEFTYDPLGRTLTRKRAGGTMSLEYDSVGNLETRTDYIGQKTTYEYDQLNRLKKINYLQTNEPGTIPAPTEMPIRTATYSYDAISQLKTATNETGTVTFNYDNRNRVVSTTDVFGHTVAYEYLYDSAQLNQKRVKFDGALYATYNFDNTDRLQNIVDAADSTTIAFGYDNNDRMTSRSLPNGVSTTVEYDFIGRLKQLADAGGSTNLNREYSYNSASQIQQISGSDPTRTFGYDNVDRLTSATYSAPGQQNESYIYDDVGNRTNSNPGTVYNYQAGQFNRLASTVTTTATETRTTATFAYDANGNLTRKVEAEKTPLEGSKRWSFLWDHDNRLTMAWDGKDRVRYRYDALGRRVQRLVSTRGENTKFIYDGDDVLVDDNNGVLTKYINGPGVDNKLKMTTGGTVRYFISDHLGSTSALTDANGTIVEDTQYDSFGNATANLSTRYQFTGREFDNLTGLHYYRARWYDASVGRFISEDPIGFAGGDVNLYGYVGNNPLSWLDQFGLQAGPINYLRDPVEHDSAYNLGGLTNGVANTISDLLSLDEIAEWSWNIGDHCLPLGDRIRSGVKLAGTVLLNVGGGGIVARYSAKAFKWVRYGEELVPFGDPKKLRVALFGNRTGHKYGRFPHYHRKGGVITKGAKKGQTLPGQSINRHRPFESHADDKSFWDRF